MKVRADETASLRMRHEVSYDNGWQIGRGAGGRPWRRVQISMKCSDTRLRLILNRCMENTAAYTVRKSPAHLPTASKPLPVVAQTIRDRDRDYTGQ